MTNQFQATETETKEVLALVTEEIQDLLSELALGELSEAQKVPFTPVQDAEKLDQVIAEVQRKLVALLTLDVSQGLKEDLEGFAKLEGEDGETKDIALINKVNPPLDAIISIEAKISTAIARYQKTLLDCLKMKRLLSGQMFGTRMAHTAQVSRMKRVRQITVTGNDLLKEFANGAQVNPKLEMEPIQQAKVIDLFPTETKNGEPTFEPLSDPLPFENVAQKVFPKNEINKVQEKPKSKAPEDERYCSTYED